VPPVAASPLDNIGDTGDIGKIRNVRNIQPRQGAMATVHDAGLDAALGAARDGDESGFTDLWHALQPALLRYLRVVHPHGAEDVASETWLRAAREMRDFRGDATAFRVWLFRVARNRALDELRRPGRTLESPVDVESFAAEQPSVMDTADTALESLSTEAALRLVATLPKDQAEAVLLRVMAGLDVAQTAKVLGKRSGAVRIATMRGLRRLATTMTGTPGKRASERSAHDAT
jgi:RNA polymerase sigma-70 factor (ECF subfamily)